MKAYYDDDLSLAEVALGVGISRQGVRHVIKRGEEQLLFLEEHLGLAAEGEALGEAKSRLINLRDALARCEGTPPPELIAELTEIIGVISNKD